MSSLLDPLHPGTLFLQKKLGQQFISSMQIVMPPASALNLGAAPPSGRIWLLVIGSQSTLRDAVTTNPLISPNVYVYFRHSMVVSGNIYIGLESYYRTPWAFEVDLRTNDPLTVGFVNNTALTIVMDISYAMIDITEDKYALYMRLWEGLYNFELLLGGLKDVDVESLVSLLKTFRQPVVPLPTPEPKREVTTSPTMSEDIGKPIKRIEIP